MQQLKMIGIAGSLRKDSFNKIILRHMAEQRPDAVDFSIYDLKHIPLFNGDLEVNGDPETVMNFKEAVEKADGLVIVTPEYSHGVPGVLKNALDWAASVTNQNVLDNKPAFVLGASPSPLGTAFAQAQVKQTLTAAGALVLQQPELYIGGIQNKLDKAGNLTDEKTRKALGQSMDTFIHWIQKMNT
ncbi:NADPH-dependent FMN reductase [Alteribacillus bidgolensis]|uniref:Chromate reductase n=1 Tax=Alteribacillus bidgolensis TaxID=930129 RepID=A0A1G8J9G8_9BACI|nr:NADPH-dependent FMN reductase [Alteribacillus bidgolensis]SDI27875.1 chromate reductase [Alteribacillus bidgolensis]